MSNSSTRQPLLLSFTFGYLSPTRRLTAVGHQQSHQPRNGGDAMSSLSPLSPRSLMKLGGGDGNVYGTVNLLQDDGKEKGGGNVTELVPAANLDTVAHFSVIIAFSEVILYIYMCVCDV